VSEAYNCGVFEGKKEIPDEKNDKLVQKNSVLKVYQSWNGPNRCG
jgi:hypothetical protein